MAFEDFTLNQPVISATDYDEIKIKSGEGAHTENFNRGIIDSINRDIALESGLTYLARSSSLFTTSNTKFLSHCEGQGIDIVTATAPVLTTNPEDVFLPDSTFIGAAWPQRATTNMMMYGTADSSLKSLSGWSLSNPEDLNATVTSTSDEYTVISTLNSVNDIVPGTVSITSDKIPLTGTGIGSLNKVSGGFTLVTDNNMMSTNTEVVYTFNLLNSEGAQVSTNSTSIIKGEYDGVVGIENIDIPDGATQFQIVIQIKFKESDSRASFTLKNVMVQAGGILSPYTQTSRPQCTCEYKNVVNPTNGDISVMCWSIFKEYSLATHAGPIGPLFIVTSRFRAGGVHQAKDGTNLVFSLYVKLDDNEPMYGPEVTVPQEYLGEYLLSCVRIRKNEDNPTNSIVEFSIAAGPNIFKSSLEVPTEYIESANLVLGNDQGSTDFFNGPVTEVRYDKEWVNDIELYIISLAKKAFSFKKSNDLGAADAGESVLDTLDKIGVNLILNPTGALAFVGWNNYPSESFDVVHNDPYAGNCFIWVGQNSTEEEIDIISDTINVIPNNLYTMRSVMYSDSGSSGDAGFGIIWYDSDDMELSRAKVTMTHISMSKYYQVSAVSPSNAVTAKAFMYVGTDINTTRVTWSRLKLEMGDATQFTDDSGAQYALYY